MYFVVRIKIDKNQNNGDLFKKNIVYLCFFTKNQIMGIRLIFFLILFCGSIQAQTFYNAVIIQHDGTQIECLARLPSAMVDTKSISIKMNDKSKTQKIKSKDIKTISYFDRGKKIIEIEYNRYTSYLEISNNQKNMFASEWMEVLVRGNMMLYIIKETSSYSEKRKSYFYHYYVKRKNEDFATEIAYVRYKNDFLIYRMEAGDYFYDAPDIERKIENREEGYTAKDIVDIVKEYNTHILQ